MRNGSATLNTFKIMIDWYKDYSHEELIRIRDCRDDVVGSNLLLANEAIINENYFEALDLIDELLWDSIDNKGYDFVLYLNHISDSDKNITLCLLFHIISKLNDEGFDTEAERNWLSDTLEDDWELLKYKDNHDFIHKEEHVNFDSLTNSFITETHQEFVHARNGIVYDKDFSEILFSTCAEGEVILSESVKTIWASAFAESDIKYLEAPCVEVICGGAFMDCEFLKGIILGKHVKYCYSGDENGGYHAFWGCYGLKRIEFWDNIESIGLIYLQSLEEIIIHHDPELGSPTPIGKSIIIEDCENLKRVSIPTSMTFQTNAFKYCPLLERIDGMDENKYCIYDHALYTADMKTLISVFSSGELFTIPEGVENVGLNSNDPLELFYWTYKQVIFPSSYKGNDYEPNKIYDIENPIVY